MTPQSRLRVSILGLNYAPEPTGIAPYTTGLARFLAEAGHDVHVVTGLPHYPHWQVDPAYRGRLVEERDGDVRITRVAHPVPANPVGPGRIAMEAAFAARATRVVTGGRTRPDVVIAVSPALLSVAAAATLRRPGRTALGVIPQDLYGHALAETRLGSGRTAAAAAALERRLLARADGVVAIHGRFRSSIAALGVDEDRITTIRNWTHVPTAPRHPSDLAAVRSELGWRDDEIIALHAGNMGAKQGLENVVEAARRADQDGAPVRFVLLGHGSRRDRLRALAQGIRRIQFLDPLPTERFIDALAAADVLVLNEQAGIAEMCVPSKLTSYFAAGRPVVAATNALSAASAEIAASRAGVTVEPGSPVALLDAVVDTRLQPGDAEAMGLRGQLFAHDVLHVDAARQAYVGWVEGLAAARARPGHAPLEPTATEIGVLDAGPRRLPNTWVEPA
ncbi:glycosyltransferase family 4 protein [Actinomycetospora corticicola]|uniref:Glycosyltransferase involved in cell wall biosynthesis n=1 Tax=Actinomycetospora corticicola TaxID=663602 RepID=A0A7Y9J424_9PSEU|nr:glycosyltransferase [Actinomycetospora corticicola]NYD34673.1 glycosyltransferase involved in cell wall biosynthesis [Actinomycetospora corticicola]